MYQALYRKYRSRTFSDVVGQEHVTETLRNQIISERLSHAYLFVGTRGTGKTSCAKILSRAVNCKNPAEGNPCNQCDSCVGIENGGILDVLELDAASNNGVDNVRALREEAIYTPASVMKRVYIIDEVHMLSNSAFNALLKILEEPPPHLMFILATTELYKVPATILSRCQTFSFKRLSKADIIARLNSVADKENLTLTAEAAEKLAALADGSMRDALSLLDQCASKSSIDITHVLETIGLVGVSELLNLAASVAERNIAETLVILDKLYADGRDMSSLLGELASLSRDLLVYKLSADSPLLSGSFGSKELSSLSSKLSSEKLLFFLETIRATLFGITRGGNIRLAVEMCLIRMCDEKLSSDSSAILARIGELETGAVFNRPPNADIPAGAATCRPADTIPPVGAHSVRPPDSKPAHPSDAETPDDEKSPDAEPSATDLDHPPETEPPVTVPSDHPADTTPPVGAHSVRPSDSEFPDEPVNEISLPDESNCESPSEENYWQQILELLRNDNSIYALLSDSQKISTEYNNGILIVRASDMFTVNTITNKSEVIKQAAQTVFGREVVIKAEISYEELEKIDDEFERLSKFGVKFED